MARAYVCRTGRVPYPRSWAWQRALQARRQQGEVPDFLLLVEHPPTYTCGRSTRPEHLLKDAALLARQGAAMFEIERGGSVTYHGPGQLVGYPIIDLRPRGRDVHQYLRHLEEVLMRTLSGYGVEAHARPPLTGVWSGEHKIASIGVHVRHWITMHGFALNVCPDLEPFSAILPCGLAGETLTSMSRLLTAPPPLAAVTEEVQRHFAAVFDCELEEVAPATLDALDALADPAWQGCPEEREPLD